MSIYAGDELYGDDITTGPSETDSCPGCWALLDTEPHAARCPENDPAHDHEFWEDQ